MRPQDRPPTLEQIEIARWTASLGAVTAEALAHRTGVSVRSARGKLIAAERRKLVSRVRPFAGRPSLFTITTAGLRACDARGIKRCEVSDKNANHLIMCAAAAAALERRYPHHRVVGELELRRDERDQGCPLACAPLGASEGMKSDLHCPDLVLWPKAAGGGLPIAVEVELTRKNSKRLARICRGWARCRIVAGVLYFAPPHVERALLRTVAQVRASEQVVVIPLDSLLGAPEPVASESVSNGDSPGGNSSTGESPTGNSSTGKNPTGDSPNDNYAAEI